MQPRTYRSLTRYALLLMLIVDLCASRTWAWQGIVPTFEEQSRNLTTGRLALLTHFRSVAFSIRGEDPVVIPGDAEPSHLRAAERLRLLASSPATYVYPVRPGTDPRESVDIGTAIPTASLSTAAGSRTVPVRELSLNGAPASANEQYVPLECFKMPPRRGERGLNRPYPCYTKATPVKVEAIRDGQLVVGYVSVGDLSKSLEGTDIVVPRSSGPLRSPILPILVVPCALLLIVMVVIIRRKSRSRNSLSPLGDVPAVMAPLPDREEPDLVGIVVCPHCSAKVLAMGDGTCPSCRKPV